MAEDKDLKWDAALKDLGPRPAGNQDIWTPWDMAAKRKREEIYGRMHFLEP